jgi:glycosyltransferase involved in cell wall biosynthesis
MSDATNPLPASPGVTSPLVSFVVLCYRTEPWVGECIASILAQRAPYDFEIVAIDDCSPDGTATVLKSFQDPRMRVIVNEKNMGHAGALTRALRAARGKYIARIDSDDRYLPEFLETVVPILEKHPDVGLVYGDAAIIGPSGERQHPACDRHHGGKDFHGNELVAILEENFICAPTTCGRREAWLDLLPIPEHLAFSDWYFSVNMARKYAFYYANRVIADYRVHPENMHRRTILDRTEEKSIFWMLDTVYSQVEPDPALDAAKRRARKRVYASHYLNLGNKYFGLKMDSDARRCYSRVLRYRATKLLDPVFFRRFLGSNIGHRAYEQGKELLGFAQRSQ